MGGEEEGRREGGMPPPEGLAGKGNPLLLGGKKSTFLRVKIDQHLGKLQHSIVTKNIDLGCLGSNPTSAHLLDS